MSATEQMRNSIALRMSVLVLSEDAYSISASGCVWQSAAVSATVGVEVKVQVDELGLLEFDH